MSHRKTYLRWWAPTHIRKANPIAWNNSLVPSSTKDNNFVFWESVQEQACSTCMSFRFFILIVLLRETGRLWENWLITQTAFPSPQCDMSCARLVVLSLSTAIDSNFFGSTRVSLFPTPVLVFLHLVSSNSVFRVLSDCLECHLIIGGQWNFWESVL